MQFIHLAYPIIDLFFLGIITGGYGDVTIRVKPFWKRCVLEAHRCHKCGHRVCRGTAASDPVVWEDVSLSHSF